MGKIVIEGNKMLFYKNEISEREFEKINTAPFGAPPCKMIEVDTDFSGGEQLQQFNINNKLNRYFIENIFKKQINQTKFNCFNRRCNRCWHY